MKYLFITISLFCFSNISSSQSGWYQLYTGQTLTYYGIHFLDPHTGVACSNNRIVKTTNGGLNWTVYNTEVTAVISDIKMLSSKNIIGICDGGKIIKSTNGGLNWSVVFSSPPGFIYMKNLVFTDSLNGYAVAQTNTVTGNIYRTSDGGDNWVMSTIGNPVSISFNNFSTGWIHRSYSVGPPFNYFYIAVSRTTNSGINWSTIYNLQTFSINPGPILFTNQYLGYKVIQLGVAYIERSSDAGETWAGIYNSSDEIESIYFVNPNTGWFTGRNGKIIHTENSGNSFSEQNSGVNTTLNSVYFINDSTGWISTSNGLILKTVTGGITNINSVNGVVPEKNILYGNYPNPFNPVTKIRFSLTRSSNVRLFICNVSGIKVDDLINEYISAGEYEIKWNGESYPGGVYFYKIESDNLKGSGKMILVK
ncbi:MAG: T9SS type A sorting domain-containing protein [Bacteroidetes bacterium]|nr:T9SS type A sorting domain-containing protein [Bacteroidota bacterium]